MEDKKKIGVICPSEIAIRRFMPALSLIDEFEFAGVGVCSKEEREEIDSEGLVQFEAYRNSQVEKAKVFTENYGGEIFDSYESIVTSDDVDAIYIPLPPALHYKWAKLALESGKHVLVEKPSTTSKGDTDILIEIARKAGLALHENYMFIYHSQLYEIEKIIQSGEIGEIRLFRISFGFPRRDAKDFRYSRKAGGGALLDAGGYTMKYASRLLGTSAKLVQAQANLLESFEVDMYGSAVMVNDYGMTAQLAFGMDNDYKCELEIWGSTGTLYTNRVLTAPVGFEPTIRISKNGVTEKINLPADDAFRKSICRFNECIFDDGARNADYAEIQKQAGFVDDFRHYSGLEL